MSQTFNCPRCGGDKFKRNGPQVYCTTGNDHEICGYSLTKEEKKEFYLYYGRFDKKKYNKKFYENKIDRQPGLKLSDAAIIKFCTYNNVLKNIHRFDILPGFKPVRIKLNDKFLNWRCPGKPKE